MCLNRLIFLTFWLDICKLIRIRFRIQLIIFDVDPDADLGCGCGCGSDQVSCPEQDPELFFPGLWIRIHFFRIRIQSMTLEANTDPDPIRIQGFNDQKLKKNYS
jgi:hypothetical protein